MDYFLTEEQIMIRDLARQIAEEKVVPVREELDEKEEFPWEIMKACADTGLFGDMRLIGEEGLDLAVVPIGDNYTMGPADALRAVKLLQPKHVIPIHFNTWDLIAQDPVAWAKRVESETAAKPHVLKPGQSFEL